MEYRTLPNGQKISTIGVGVGNYGYENVAPEEIRRIFEVAFEQGVNFLIPACLYRGRLKPLPGPFRGSGSRLS